MVYALKDLNVVYEKPKCYGAVTLKQPFRLNSRLTPSGEQVPHYFLHLGIWRLAINAIFIDRLIFISRHRSALDHIRGVSGCVSGASAQGLGAGCGGVSGV